MTKEQYMEISKDDPDVIELSNQDIIVWMDAIAESLRQARSNMYDLAWGEINVREGEYENNIHLCGITSEYRSLHIYSGIEKLAEAIGATLSRDVSNSREYKDELYFNYKGVRFFELAKEGK